MRFSTLILALSAAATASAAAVEKRGPHFYFPTFLNLHAATEAADYLTYKLVPTIPACFQACNNEPKCKFVNTYHDVHGKGGSPLLTCSLYASCHWANTAINAGGQTQPSGLLDFIIQSDGWCQF